MNRPVRISLKAEDFVTLITGKIVKTDAITGAVCPREIPVEIALQDIGYSFMLEKLLEAFQVWPKEETQFGTFQWNGLGEESETEVRIGKILFERKRKLIRFRIADQKFDITPELITFGKDDVSRMMIGNGVVEALKKIIK